MSPYETYYRPSPFGGFRFFPPVIKTLLVSNVVVYFLMNFLGLFRIEGRPLSIFLDAILPLYPLGAGFHVWQLFTYMFMHGGLMHLLFNMVALWMFGMELENTWGSRKFLRFYLLCGLGAAFSNLLIAPLVAETGPTVGASGAIYGVLLAFGIMFPDRPIFIYFLFPIRARYFVMFYILLEIYAGVTGTADGIAHFAHLGGAAVGLLIILLERQGFSLRRLSGGREGIGSGKGPISTTSVRWNVSDATYSDLGDERGKITQERIDEILDKISRDGYQNLTEEEKKILFEASKKLN